MASRLELHEKLCEILGSREVYFQPPESKKMKYPAIVYGRKKIDNKYADDQPYIQLLFYDVTVIYKDPDSKIVEEISRLPMCEYDRHYNSDDLNHDVFTLCY